MHSPNGPTIKTCKSSNRESRSPICIKEKSFHIIQCLTEFDLTTCVTPSPESMTKPVRSPATNMKHIVITIVKAKLLSCCSNGDAGVSFLFFSFLFFSFAHLQNGTLPHHCFLHIVQSTILFRKSKVMNGLKKPHAMFYASQFP